MYHASKWGVEGFFDSLIGEVAPFGISITMVEPGNVRTGFGAAMSIADALPAYADTPVGQVRRVIEGASGNLTGSAPGDPRKVASAIIASAAGSPAPRRLVLGRDAYEAVKAALTGRVEEVEAGRSVAFSTDFGS
jgi:NAD(P)-dependent dehydrogenase (short-subunit alcohol dehydrogenase family)